MVASILAGLQPGWVVLALAVTAAQFALSAWRWRYTALRLGTPLAYAVSVREYYLAAFVNQVLPGGVLGDVSRAWRQALRARRRGPAIRSVILERASGQLVMALTATGSLLLLPTLRPDGWAAYWPAGGLLVALILAFLLARGRLERRCRPWQRFRADTRRALFSMPAFPVQLLTSALVVGSYLLVYLIAARAVGDETPAAVLVPLVPVVLLAMLIPLGFAGWGVREGAAALIWALAGLDPNQGVAIAVAYGLLVLAGSLPGAAVLWLELRRGSLVRGPAAAETGGG